MELESKVFAQQRMIASADLVYMKLPSEFRSCTMRYMRGTSDLSDRIFAFATLCAAAALLLPFFLTPFAASTVQLRASSLEGSEGLGFVTFLGEVEDASDLKMKDMFGWGGLDLIDRAAQALAPHLQNCRAQLQSARASPAMTFKFDVKIDVQKPGFLVSGLVSGQESEPDVATCLRDKINNLQIESFARLRSAPSKSYRLRLGVQLAHATDAGAP